jgi:hypothetical protein
MKDGVEFNIYLEMSKKIGIEYCPEAGLLSN